MHSSQASVSGSDHAPALNTAAYDQIKNMEEIKTNCTVFSHVFEFKGNEWSVAAYEEVYERLSSFLTYLNVRCMQTLSRNKYKTNDITESSKTIKTKSFASIQSKMER